MAAPAVLQLTGERTLPGIWHENYWFRRHEAAYRRVAGELAPPATGRLGPLVLDAGAGEGYGAALLADRGLTTLALDLDPAVLAHLVRRYSGPRAVRADLAVLPFAPASLDAVVCLQVVEHLADQASFLAACRRVLRPGGRLALSTPNRLTFSPGSSPRNPFHTRELAPQELAELLAGFADVRLGGVRHGGRLRRYEARFGPVPAALLAAPPERWPADLAALVAAVTADDFVVTPAHLDTALDLLAVAVVPRR